MSQPLIPVVFRRVPRTAKATAASKFLPAIAARVSFAWPVCAIMKCPVIA